MNYLEIRDSLKTFDVINCEQKDIFWRLIGHTAIVYKDELTGQLMVLESTSLNKWTGISGVQLTPMGTWVDRYPGKIFIRQFDFQPDFVITGSPEDFIKEHLNTSYPNYKKWDGLKKLISAVIYIPWFVGKDLATYHGEDKGIFCTELVVLILRYCGLMHNNRAASDFEPDNFRTGLQGCVEKFLVNCKLGKEIRIK